MQKKEIRYLLLLRFKVVKFEVIRLVQDILICFLNAFNIARNSYGKIIGLLPLETLKVVRQLGIPRIVILQQGGKRVSDLGGVGVPKVDFIFNAQVFLILTKLHKGRAQEQHRNFIERQVLVKLL